MPKFSLENLKDAEFLNKLEEQIDEIEFHNDVNQAAGLLHDIQDAYKRNEAGLSSVLKNEYEVIIIRLKFVLFLSIPTNEVEDMLEKNLNIGIQMTYIDMLELLKVRISFIPIEDRDKYKKQLIELLVKNNSLITMAPIQNNKKQTKPTIAAWINYYNAKMGTSPKSNIEVVNFFTNDLGIGKLEEIEKLWVKELVDIYEYLKRSSFTLEGNEDDEIISEADGRTFHLKEGAFVEVKTEDKRPTEVGGRKLNVPMTHEEKRIYELKGQEEQYAAGGLERLVIKEEIDKKIQIEDLQAEANKYKVGSLEHKAIEGEISKLKKH